MKLRLVPALGALICMATLPLAFASRGRSSVTPATREASIRLPNYVVPIGRPLPAFQQPLNGIVGRHQVYNPASFMGTHLTMADCLVQP